MTYLMSTYAAPSVTFVRGQGSYLWDEEGRRYLDFLSGLAVTSLGHAHPAVAEAVCRALRASSRSCHSLERSSWWTSGMG